MYEVFRNWSKVYFGISILIAHFKIAESFQEIMCIGLTQKWFNDGTLKVSVPSFDKERCGGGRASSPSPKVETVRQSGWIIGHDQNYIN